MVASGACVADPFVRVQRRLQPVSDTFTKPSSREGASGQVVSTKPHAEPGPVGSQHGPSLRGPLTPQLPRRERPDSGTEPGPLGACRRLGSAAAPTLQPSPLDGACACDEARLAQQGSGGRQGLHARSSGRAPRPPANLMVGGGARVAGAAAYILLERSEGGSRSSFAEGMDYTDVVENRYWREGGQNGCSRRPEVRVQRPWTRSRASSRCRGRFEASRGRVAERGGKGHDWRRGGHRPAREPLRESGKGSALRGRRPAFPAAEHAADRDRRAGVGRGRSLELALSSAAPKPRSLGVLGPSGSEPARGRQISLPLLNRSPKARPRPVAPDALPPPAAHGACAGVEGAGHQALDSQAVKLAVRRDQGPVLGG
jgi:hypothetical protein